MSRCEMELCDNWTGHGCVCDVLDLQPEPTTSETVLAAFPELRDTDYGRYLDMLDREAERSYQQFRADMDNATKLQAVRDSVDKLIQAQKAGK